MARKIGTENVASLYYFHLDVVEHPFNGLAVFSRRPSEALPEMRIPTHYCPELSVFEHAEVSDVTRVRFEVTHETRTDWHQSGLHVNIDEIFRRSSRIAKSFLK
jgi:hypothetical protein